jgi:hypothetical protein
VGFPARASRFQPGSLPLAGCSVKHEVNAFIPTSSMRADFTISDTHARTTTLFDVVTCCPTHHNSSTYLCRSAATMPGKAAGDGEIYKQRKWLHHCQAMDLLFVALAHENGGRMGEAARKFLDRLVLRVGARPLSGPGTGAMLNKDSHASTQKARPDWCSPSRTTSVAAAAPSLARPGTSGSLRSWRRP